MDDEVRAFWNPNWTQANAVFESQLNLDPSFISYKIYMLYIWNGNHIFFAWKNYIDRVHTKDYERHVFVDSIILALEHDDIPSLLIVVHDINK